MKVENLEKIVTLIENSNKKICLFLGAGADISSGGKSFSALKKDIINNYSEYISKGLISEEIDTTFEDIIDFKGHSREVLLESINSNNTKSISDGYKIMVLLAKYGFIETVITTNFFDCLEKTEETIGESVFDYYINDRSLNSEEVDTVRRVPKYIKLHGDAKRFCISHVTNDEINNKPYSKRTINLIAKSLKESIVIFIGYSGSDAKVTEIILDQLPNIDNIYWIDPKINSDSVLIKKLIEEDKIIYNDSKFDDFIIKLGLRYLYKIKLNDSHPILIYSLLKANTHASIQPIKSMPGPNVEREEYLRLKDLKKINILTGRSGIGKTYLIKYFIEHSYKMQTLYLDFKNSNDVNILKEIVCSFGFVSETPFSLLYNICSWYNSNKLFLTIILDGVNVSEEETLNELISFMAATKKLSNIYFIISSNNERILSIANKYFSEPDYQLIKMSIFSPRNIEDMAMMLNVNTADLIDINLLSEPYICHLICKYYYDKLIENTCNIFEIIEDCLAERINVSPLLLHEDLITIAKNGYENTPSAKIHSGEFLASIGLIESVDNPIYKYDKFNEYYLHCYLFRNDVEKIKQQKMLFASFKNKQKLDISLYKSYIYYYTIVNTTKEYTIRLLQLNDILKEVSNEWSICFVRACLKRIFLFEEKHLFDVLNVISFSSLCYELQRLVIEQIQLLENDEFAYSIFNKIQSINKFTYELSIYSIDRFCEKVLWFPNLSEKENYYDKYKSVVFSGTSEVKILKLLYLLMKLDTYKDDKKEFALYMVNEVKKEVANCDVQNLISLLKKYSYNVFFNSDSDLEAKFNAISYNENLISIINHVVSGHALSFKHYEYLVCLTSNLDNMLVFLVSNIIVIQSMTIDLDSTLSIAKKLIIENDALEPQNIDFILSSIFMGLYHMNPQNRDDFVSFFEYTYRYYETSFFEQPTLQRKSTTRKFADEFSQVFEDGFNPTAFLFYTSPLEQPQNRLTQYWVMCKNLSDSGNISKILKIVHAIGQMISIYPDDGFSALNKVCDYSQHDIIKKGIVRVLKESLVRYPAQTKSFVTTQNIFEQDELISLFGHIDEFFINRTLEQLHWSRLLFLAKLVDSSILKRALSLICETNSLSKYVKDMLCLGNP